MNCPCVGCTKFVHRALPAAGTVLISLHVLARYQKMTEGPEKTKVSRRLAAILAADIAGYGALMGADEAETVRSLKEHQAVVLPMIKEHGGRVIDTAGDGILAEFGSVVNAAECAVAIQRTMAERNADVDEARRMRFRIGINRFRDRGSSLGRSF
jgi:class 3 adenylate cyclase